MLVGLGYHRNADARKMLDAFADGTPAPWKVIRTVCEMESVGACGGSHKRTALE